MGLGVIIFCALYFVRYLEGGFPNMRRYLAYSVMMLTVTSALVFNTQAVMERRVDAQEYGKGTRVSYGLSEREESDYESTKYPTTTSNIADLSTTDIEKKVMERLDSAGIRNADVQIEKGDSHKIGYRLNLEFSPISDKELSNVEQILSRSGTLSISTVGCQNVIYQESSSLFGTGDIAKITYNGTTPYPTLYINDDTAFSDLMTKAKNDSDTFNGTTDKKEANRLFASDTSSDSSTTDKPDYSSKLYLWQNLTPVDSSLAKTFDEALGTNDTVVVDKQKAKLLATLDVSNYSSDNKYITLTSDNSGAAFDISTARALVTALNASDYGFDIEYLYSTSTFSSFGSSAVKKTYLGLGIALLVVILALIAIYGLAGLTASLDLLFSLFLSFYVFTLVGFEFSIAGLCGLFVSVVLSVLISVNYFEKTKGLLKKGTPLEKANKDGYHNSFLPNLDIGLSLFVGTLFSFLVSQGQYRTFFGALLVGSIISWILVTFLNKWMLYWLCKDQAVSFRGLFSFRKKEKDVPSVKVVHAKNGSYIKRLSITSGIIALGLALALPLTYNLIPGTDSFFHGTDSYASKYTLDFTFEENNDPTGYLTTNEEFLSYLEAVGKQNSSGHTFVAASSESSTADATFHYYPDSVLLYNVKKTNKVKDTYYVQYYSVEVDKDLNTTKIGGESITDILNYSFTHDSIQINDTSVNVSPKEDSHFIKDDLVIGCYKTDSANLGHDTRNLFLVLFLLALFCSIYTFLRYGISLFLTQLSSGTLFAAGSVALLSVTRIGYNPYTGLAFLVTALIFQMLLIPAFGLYKSICKERGLSKKDNCLEEREEALNEAVSQNGKTLVFALASSAVLVLGFLPVSTEVLSLCILSLISLALCVPVYLFYSVPMELLISSHISFRGFAKKMESRRVKKHQVKTEKKDGEIRYVDEDQPHETIIVGLNEFRR